MNRTIKQLDSIAAQIRGKVIEMSYQSKAAHLGSALSCIDILVALYWEILSIDPDDPENVNRDRFILSKGHAASAIYATLAYKGFFPESLLDLYAQNGSSLEEHPGPKSVPGIEAATGSLGHGLPIGIGKALAGRIQANDYKVFALLSDGECNEGSVWEGAMFASAQQLDNLTVIVDFNKWQATGRSCEVMSLEPLVEKWRSFGWNAFEIDGHDIKSILQVLSDIPDGSKKPVAVVAHTVKGKGVSFMEDDNNWHYRIPTEQEVIEAKRELGLL